MTRSEGVHAVRTLLSQVVYNPDYNGLEGLSPIQALLDKDADGTVAAELLERLPTLPEDDRYGPSKNAAGALRHYARKSSSGCAAVRQALAARPPDVGYRENRRLQQQLDALE